MILEGVVPEHKSDVRKSGKAAKVEWHGEEKAFH